MRYWGLFLLCIFSIVLQGQTDITGQWKAIDDVDGQPSSYIDIYMVGDKLHGKITEILNGPADAICEKCDGEKKNKPIKGLEIIWDMSPSGKDWKGGRIMDPKNGKTYKCRLRLVDDVLEVRGYIGLPALGRTQKWYRK